MKTEHDTDFWIRVLAILAIPVIVVAWIIINIAELITKKPWRLGKKGGFGV